MPPRLKFVAHRHLGRIHGRRVRCSSKSPVVASVALDKQGEIIAQGPLCNKINTRRNCVSQQQNRSEFRRLSETSEILRRSEGVTPKLKKHSFTYGAWTFSTRVITLRWPLSEGSTKGTSRNCKEARGTGPR